ncbi:MAG: hypothetical protein AB7S36_18650, partial [Planctomycetota bacterium]
HSTAAPTHTAALIVLSMRIVVIPFEGMANCHDKPVARRVPLAGPGEESASSLAQSACSHSFGA